MAWPYALPGRRRLPSMACGTTTSTTTSRCATCAPRSTSCCRVAACSTPTTRSAPDWPNSATAACCSIPSIADHERRAEHCAEEADASWSCASSIVLLDHRGETTVMDLRHPTVERLLRNTNCHWTRCWPQSVPPWPSTWIPRWFAPVSRPGRIIPLRQIKQDGSFLSGPAR